MWIREISRILVSIIVPSLWSLIVLFEVSVIAVVGSPLVIPVSIVPVISIVPVTLVVSVEVVPWVASSSAIFVPPLVLTTSVSVVASGITLISVPSSLVDF